MTEEDVNGAPVLALSYFLFFALFFAAAGALFIHSYCINQLFFSLHSVLFAKHICTYLYLLPIILTSGTLQTWPYSLEMMQQLQHEYITTTATIISDTRA